MDSSAASSSSALSMKMTCFYCRDPSAILKLGWQLNSGAYSLLCDRCASANEQGRFCNIFHSDDSGWRDCVTCKKHVHCGCIMSAHRYSLLDVGDGIKCTECISNEILEGTESFEIKTKNCPHWTCQDLQGLMEASPSVDSDKKITETTPGAPSQKDSPSLPNSAYSHDAAKRPYRSSKNNRKTQSYAPRRALRQYTPNTTKAELQQIKRDANSVVIPMFEKTLTASDADHRSGRLVVPKKCAMNYLPKISDPQGLLINFKDTSGKYWEFYFRFWPNNNSIMYVLEGTRDYLISNQCQAGDKVTFYRIDPGGQLVIGLKKSTQPTTSDQKKRLRSSEKNAKGTSGEFK